VTISEQISELCDGLAVSVPWGTFVPGHAQEQVISAALGSGAGEEGGSGTGGSPAPGAERDD
jgi:hypothetical protein